MKLSMKMFRPSVANIMKDSVKKIGKLESLLAAREKEVDLYDGKLEGALDKRKAGVAKARDKYLDSIQNVIKNHDKLLIKIAEGKDEATAEVGEAKNSIKYLKAGVGAM